MSGPLQVVPDIDDQVNHPEQEVNPIIIKGSENRLLFYSQYKYV